MYTPAGRGFAFPVRILCDRCAPDRQKLRDAKAITEAMAGCIFALAVAAAVVFGYFLWLFLSVPLPESPDDKVRRGAGPSRRPRRRGLPGDGLMRYCFWFVPLLLLLPFGIR